MTDAPKCDVANGDVSTSEPPIGRTTAPPRSGRSRRRPDPLRDAGSASIMLMIYLVIVLAAAALIFDGGNYLIAERHASNTAEGAARAAVSSGSPSEGLTASVARQAAIDHAAAVGVPAGDVTVSFPARDVVIVSITERRDAVFVRFAGSATIAATAEGRARLEFS